MNNISEILNTNNISLARMGKFPTLLLREFYEHKTAFFTVPVVISALVLLMVVVGLVTGNNMPIRIDGIDITGGEFILDHVDSDELVQIQRAMTAAMLAIGGIVLFILPFVVIFPLLNSLYEERIERSYLFWKSMPVSDLQEVLAKLLFIVVMGPILLFIIASVLSLATMILLTPYFWANDLPFVNVMWSETPYITGWIGLGANYLVWALWALPIFGWIMLASAYAPKAPLMYAVIPPVVIIALENIMTRGHSVLAEAIGSRLGQKFGGVMAQVIEPGRFNKGNINFDLPNFGDALSALATSFMDPSFWMGTAVAMAFIMGAVYMRRYRI